MTVLIDLLEQTVYDPALATTRVLQFSSASFSTQPGESPPNGNPLYDSRLSQPGTMDRDALGVLAENGTAKSGIGAASLNNTDGGLDDLRRVGFGGWPHVRRRGPMGGAYPADFPVVFEGLASGEPLVGSTVTIGVRDQQADLDAPFQETKFAGDNVLPDGLEGGPELAGKPKPVVFGSVFNMSPLCVNTSRHIYQPSDSELDSIDVVRDRGAQLGTNLALVVGSSTASSRVASINANGGAFRSADVSTFGGALYSATFGFDKLFVGSVDGEIRSSLDGAVWSTVTSTLGAGDFVYALKVSRALLIVGATGAKLYTSPDGVTLTSRTSNFAGNSVQCITDDGTNFVIGGDGGKVSTSPTGVTWTARTSGFGTSMVRGAAASSTAVIIVGGDAAVNSKIGRSTDHGATYSAMTSPFGTSTPFGVKYSASRERFIAVASDGKIATSDDDGQNWILRADGIGIDFLAIEETENGFVAVGNGDSGSIAGSEEGTVWTVVPSSIQESASLQAIAFADSLAPAAYASAADLEDDALAPAPGMYKVFLDAAGSYFRAGAPPDGAITADVTEGATAADRTAAQCATRALARRGYISGDWSAADVTALDALNNAVVYEAVTEETTLGAVVDRLLGGIGAFRYADRAAVIRMKRLDGPPENLVTAPDDPSAAPWVNAGFTITPAAVTVDGRDFALLEGVAGAATTYFPLTGLFTGNGAKRYAFYLKAFPGQSGQTFLEFYDNTASADRGLTKFTVLANGQVAAQENASAGRVIDVRQVGDPADGVYRVVAEAVSVVAANANRLYFTLGGATTLLKFYVSGVEVLDAIPSLVLYDTPTRRDLMAPLEPIATGEPGAGAPRWRTIVKYRRNYTPQTSDIAGAVSDADRADLAREWSSVTSDDAAVKTTYPLAVQRTVESSLAESSDAQDEADRQQELRGVVRETYPAAVQWTTASLAVELTDVVELVSDRYGLEGGALFRVLRAADDAGANTVTLTLWGRRSVET